MAHAPRLAVVFCGLALGASPLQAPAQPAMPSLQPPLHSTTPEGYLVHVESLRDLVHACRSNPSACDPKAVGEDDRVEASGGAKDGSFQTRWQWLRTVVGDAHNPALKDRNALLDQAAARLDQELTPAASEAPPQTGFDQARRSTDAILATPEFRIVTRESWWDRKMAAFWNWVNRIFSSAYDFGHRAPWLAPVLEWGFVGLTGVGVLVWVLRSMQRQRLAVSLGRHAAVSDWQKESADWAERARTEADLGNWREAVHCVYWASIVALESRRLWRRDYARTPREYVRLLESGSPQQIALRTLTRIFERIWYGLRGAGREDYDRALALFEDLRRA